VDFHPVEFNLRESFRVLADNRERGDVLELPGVSIASLGVKFQMFNAAFLNAPVETAEELDERLRIAAGHFRSRALRWSLWICEDWLSAPVRRVLSQRCERVSLRLCADMPGMSAKQLKAAKRKPPALEYVSVDSARTLEDFRGIGSLCFHVPMDWFAEVFENQMLAARPRFRCYVAYLNGLPVATAATVLTGGVLGIYNVATAPGHRRRGIAEAITRYLIETAKETEGVVLQSTAHGFRLYERIGFQSVTRILVYNSMP
jgi:ribosomal protein S18 acetylase RimI-like enzyme